MSSLTSARRKSRNPHPLGGTIGVEGDTSEEDGLELARPVGFLVAAIVDTALSGLFLSCSIACSRYIANTKLIAAPLGETCLKLSDRPASHSTTPTDNPKHGLTILDKLLVPPIG